MLRDNPSRFDFVYYICHMDYPRIEPGLPCWEAGRLDAKPWHNSVIGNFTAPKLVEIPAHYGRLVAEGVFPVFITA